MLTENFDAELKKFNNHDSKNWFCPLIGKFCDHKCYNYVPEQLYLLCKQINSSHKNYWSPSFRKSKEADDWVKNLEMPTQILEVRIHPPYCKYFDAIVEDSNA